MTSRELTRLLESKGCSFVRSGKGSHQIWHCPGGCQTVIPGTSRSGPSGRFSERSRLASERIGGSDEATIICGSLRARRERILVGDRQDWTEAFGRFGRTDATQGSTPHSAGSCAFARYSRVVVRPSRRRCLSEGRAPRPSDVRGHQRGDASESSRARNGAPTGCKGAGVARSQSARRRRDSWSHRTACATAPRRLSHPGQVRTKVAMDHKTELAPQFTSRPPPRLPTPPASPRPARRVLGRIRSYATSRYARSLRGPCPSQARARPSACARGISSLPQSPRSATAG